MSESSRIEEQATLWRVRSDNPEWSAQDQEALDAWLEQDTAHRVAWLRICYGWQRIDRLSALRAPVEVKAVVPARRWPARSRLAMAASLLMVLGAGLFLALGEWRSGSARYVTELGGHETVALRDGSRVELNTDTLIRTAVDETSRRVWLDRGEAYFDVKRDPGRPFVIDAGTHRIVVLGTRFSARRDGERVEVVVEEGKVRVEEKAAKGQPKVAVATKGDRVLAEVGSLLLTPTEPEKVTTQLAWRNGVLVFERKTLADAAVEFNRYNKKKLHVDAALQGEIRISGSFDANNVEAFARLLRRAYGLDVAADGDMLVISN